MTAKKIARNALCPCGSGHKYKKCCQGQAAPSPTAQAIPIPKLATIADLLKSGLAYQQAGQLAQAEALYRQVLQQSPGQPDALHLLGLIAYHVGKHDTALQLINEAIRYAPNSAVFYNNLGLVLKELAQWESAIAAHQKALALQPDYAQAYNNLAVLFKEQGHLDKAISHFKQAIAIGPQLIEAHSNLGSCYKDTGEFALAIACHQQALLLNPDYFAAYNNLGRVFEAINDLPQAISYFRKAIALNPQDAELQHNLAIVLLKSGEFAEGWQYYESRYHPSRKNPNTQPPKLPFQQWQGELLTGKALLIWTEQGFGDEIQFSRYVLILKAMGAARITLTCKAPLKPLLATLADVDQLLVAKEITSIGYHDFWTFPLSIPLHCATTLDTLPAYPQYLAALPERIQHWQPKLPTARFRVGLVWKGSSLHKNDANRSISHLNLLAPVWGVGGITFISLQKGQGEDETDGLPLLHLGSDIQDFADTAAIVAQLDLIICVDTVIAHLAGALGKPVWLLLPFSADWRWLTGRTDSPWYPQMVLFRQSRHGDWADVFEQVKARLLAMVE
ncbi:MAG: tetratricopeptide repeat protein [Methylovulum sp.]|nr:tetratricopeptide repeat protein [Methylovulum sp.]